MKKILSMFLTLCMVLTLLPVTALAVAAPAVSVGGETLDEHNQYATTDAGTGAVTTAGATEANYNVKFEAGTLTLRNANISYDGSDVYAAIQSPGDLTIVAVGTNSVSRSGGEFYPKAIHSNGGLTLQGSGALTATSQWGVAVYGGNLTVKDGITLTAVGGEITSDQIFGRSLFAGDTLIVEGTPRSPLWVVRPTLMSPVLPSKGKPSPFGTTPRSPPWAAIPRIQPATAPEFPQAVQF